MMAIVMRIVVVQLCDSGYLVRCVIVSVCE